MPLRWQYLLLLVMVTVFWAGTFPAMKIAFSSVPPFQFMGFRYVLAAAVLFSYTWLKRGPVVLDRSEIKAAVLVGFFQTVLMNTGVILGLMHLGGGVTSVFVYTHILWTALLARWLLSEKLTGRKIAGLLMGFGGLVTVFGDQLLASSWNPLVLGGSIAVLAAAWSWAVATILVKIKLDSADKLVVNAVQLATGAGLLLLISLFTEDWRPAGWTPPVIWAFLFTVFPATVIGWTLWFWILGKGKAINTTAYLFLVPAWAILLSGWLLGERLTLHGVVGTLAIISGIVLVSSRTADDARLSVRSAG